MSTKLIGVKLTETELAAVDELIIQSRYISRSAAVREALRLLFREHGIKESTLRTIRLERYLHSERRKKRPQG